VAPAQLAQLSDPHVGDADSARALADAVRAVAGLDPPPDAVLVSGDLAQNGAAEEYERIRGLLAPLPMPVHVLAGNLDDRAGLRAHFGDAGDPYQYVTRVRSWRLVACDSTIPGQLSGSLDGGRLEWLAAQLDDDRETPTIVAMHHAPLLTGIAEIDAIGFPAHELDALADLLARHPQVQRIVCGHVHRTIAGEIGGRPVFVCPSTHMQAVLDIGGRLARVREPPGFGLHVAAGGNVASHVQPIGDYGPPVEL
jgi:3',5'-cyclic-AMP phosphodiesterase